MKELGLKSVLCELGPGWFVVNGTGISLDGCGYMTKYV